MSVQTKRTKLKKFLAFAPLILLYASTLNEFDFNYLNPVIFYRAIEFSTGSRGGNALIGLSAKYKFTNRVNAYGQLIIDEFLKRNLENDFVLLFSNVLNLDNNLGFGMFPAGKI